MLKTIEGKPVRNLQSAVVLSDKDSQVAKERIRLGKCACLTCLGKELNKTF